MNLKLAIMKNILTIHTIMNKYMKYLCAVLLLIGTCASAWATDINTVEGISSGSTYIIKAYDDNWHYLVPPTSTSYGGTSTTKASGTVFTFTYKNSSWYISFVRNSTTYYLYITGDEDNGRVSVSTTETACAISNYKDTWNNKYLKLGGGGTNHKYLQLNKSDHTKMGAYSSAQACVVLESAVTVTLKVPDGKGGWVTLNNKTQSDMTYATATSGMDCYSGYFDKNYDDCWKDGEISGSTTTKPTALNSTTGTVTAGTTYYPVWAIGSPNVYYTDVVCLVYTYNVNYNKNTSDAVTNMPSDATDYEAGDAVTVVNKIPVRSGYTFLGWSEDSEATSKDDDYDPGDSFTMPSHNVNLYAVWCRDLGDLDFTISTSSLTSTSVTLGWSLDGSTKYDWQIQDNAEYASATYKSNQANYTGTSKSFSDLSPNTKYWFSVRCKNDCGSTNTSKTINFTTLQRYTITYDANGGTGTTPSTQYRDHGAAAVTLSNGSGLSKTGHTLSRWDTNSSGTGASHAKGESYSTNADLALFAVWAPAVYTITYKDQGGASFSGSHVDSPTAHPTTHTYGTATSLNSATRTGYTFDGWFTTAGCTEGSDVTSLGATDYTANITLYAKWSPVTINLTLDANTAHGGSTGGSGSIVFGSASATITTPAVGTAGNTLLGYYDATTGGHKVLETGGDLAADNVDDYITNSQWSRAITPTTLYAQYSENVYTVSFDMHGHGSEVGDQNVAHGGYASEPTPEPTDPDWRFDGWYKEAGYVNTWNFSTEAVTGTTTIHAKWTERSYNHLIFGCVDIDLDTEDSDPILVTSRNGINIMATKRLVVNTTNAVNGHRISFSGTDLKFYKKVTESPEHYVLLDNSDATHSLTVTGEDQYVYVSYNPTSAGDNAIATPTITVACDGFSQTFDDLVQARNLPASMVIATKVGGSWYALPADKTVSDVQDAVLVSVDESTKTAYGPSTIGYKVWPVLTWEGSTTDRFGTNGTPAALYADRVRFSGNSDKGLKNSSSNHNLECDANLDAIDDNPGAPYEWKIVTTDLDAYTLQADNSGNTKYLDVYRPSSGNHAYKVVWATNDSYLSNEIHFFKLEEITSIDIIPREWKANGFVFSIAADDNISLTAGDAKYGIGEAATNNATLTRHSTGGYGLYEVALPDLTSHYGKVLTLKLKIGGVDKYATTTIPIIVNADMSTKDDAPFSTLGEASKDYDVVVLSGKTLTTDASESGAYKFQSLYLYAGSTLVNTANGNLNLRYLELRGGIKGIDAKTSLEQGVPHLMLGKKIAACPGGANLDMYVNTTHAYALSVPFTVNLANVNFANSLNTSTGAPINGTLNNQFMIMQYSATERINSGKGWQRITSTETNLTAGRGYVLEAKRPKGQPFAVIRFPLSLGTAVQYWADNENGEVEKSAVRLSAAGVGNENVSDNNRAWNLLANPYMANISYKEHDESAFVASFTVGKLVKSDTDPWDGKYVYEKDEGSYRAYVAIPNEDFSEYPQSRANAVTFEPFKNFFVQASTDGNVSFERSYRTAVAAAPSRILANFEKPAYVDINLTYGSKMAQAGLTIDANATAGYKYGEDQNIFENRDELNYLKVYTIVDGHYLVGNTLRPDEISQLIPVEFYAPGEEGDYVFSLDEGSEADDFEQIILYDDQLNKQTNLMLSDYKFTVSAKGFVEHRFYLNMTPKQETPPTPTSMEEVQGDTTLDAPLKFIYQDKMYILYHGVIYDAVGKRVSIIKR